MTFTSLVDAFSPSLEQSCAPEVPRLTIAMHGVAIRLGCRDLIERDDKTSERSARVAVGYPNNVPLAVGRVPVAAFSAAGASGWFQTRWLAPHDGGP